MARPKSTDLRRLLTSFLPRRRLTDLAAEASVPQRHHKVSVVALFWTLVPDFDSDRPS